MTTPTLVRVAVPQSAAFLKPSGVHHIVVIDCSGSMSGDLPRMREQLKTRLPAVLREDDLVTLVWFSGRGQCGVLCEGLAVPRLSDLAELAALIDRWIRPVGMTAFTEPLALAAQAARRVRASHPHLAPALLFMSDGYDNQGRRADILEAAEDLAGLVASATVVEYGYYADRALLLQIAAKLGGAHLFSEDFARYAPAFERALAAEVAGSRVALHLDAPPQDGLVFALHEGQILTFEDGGPALGVSVPAGVADVYHLVPRAEPAEDVPLAAYYAACALYAARARPEVVWALLARLGDVRLIDQYATAFGKQRISDFVEVATAAAFDPTLRGLQGFDVNRVPPEDAFTVLDLLGVLASDPHNLFLPDHPSWKYNRVGRATTAADTLPERERVALEERAREVVAVGRVSDLSALHADLGAALARRPQRATFTPDPTEGYPMSALVPNASRANLSALVRKPGSVTFEGGVPQDLPIPRPLPTQVWRNYTIVRDGVVNVDVLPVKLTFEAYERLSRAGVPLLTRLAPDGPLKDFGFSPYFVYELDLRALPVVNRAMVRRATAEDLIRREFELLRLQAEIKVARAALAELAPAASSAGLASRFGPEAAAWLREQGVTDHGFSPRTEKAEASDVYVGYELKVALKGYSTLPKVEEARAQWQAGKLKPAAALMAHAFQVIARWEGQAPDARRTHLEGYLASLTDQARDLALDLARLKFAVIVSGSWFTDLPEYGEGSVTVRVTGVGHDRDVTVDGLDVQGSVTLLEKQFEI